ncbi:MAG: alkaline phosphatase family protein, partial [Gammaproteobacteria bacterium]
TLLMYTKSITSLLLILFCSFSYASVPDNAPFKKVFIVIFENVEAEKVLAQPTFGALAKQGTYMDNFHAITHPSQPNYIALTSGSTQGVKGDAPVGLDSRNIVDLLEAKGISWKVYAEDYPGNCDPSQAIGKYARNHNPFMSYNNIRNNPQRCALIVNADQLAQDQQADNLPDFSFYIPNIDNNGHNTGIVFADNWLQTTMLPRLKDPKFMQDMLVVVTFDEGDIKHPTRQNHIYTLFYGDKIKTQTVETHYNLYSLLRTIEDSWELGTLGLNDYSNPPIQEILEKP